MGTEASEPRRLVNIEQARQHVGVSRRTIYYWIAKGLIEWTRTAGGGVRIYFDTLTRQRDPRGAKSQPVERAS